MQLNNKKQKHIVENFLSSNDLFARCICIIKPSYFDPEFRNIIRFITEYYNSYHAVPSFDIVNAEFDVSLEEKKITSDSYEYLCDTIEDFCQNRALIEAIHRCTEHIETNDYGAIRNEIDTALAVGLETDMGINLYAETLEAIAQQLENAKDSQEHVPTGVKAIDNIIKGLVRKQTTLFSANSGGGKSIMMANIGSNYVKRGYNVIYFSLELPEEMVNVRLATISSGVSIRVWDQNIPEIANTLNEQREQGAGSYIMKRLPTGSTVNYMRAYLKQYEIKFGFPPDMIISDYLDIMSPNSGKTNKSISQIDKEISEELSELAHDYNAFMISASQQNREAIRMNAPDQAVVAGGITKVNTVDNYMSITMTDENRLNGDMWLYFLKTRSSDGVGKSVLLKFNPHNLQVTDSEKSYDSIMPTTKDKIKKIKEKKNDSDARKHDAGMRVKGENIVNMPGKETVTSNVPDRVSKLAIDENESVDSKKDEPAIDDDVKEFFDFCENDEFDD